MEKGKETVILVFEMLFERTHQTVGRLGSGHVMKAW